MSLNIIVLAKQVPDTRNVGKDAMKEDGTINRAALPAIFNPEDLNALEQALRLKDANPGATVTLLTMGLPRASEIIREAIYRGADNGIVLTDRTLGGADTLATSYSLAQAVKKFGKFDVILGLNVCRTPFLNAQVRASVKYCLLSRSEFGFFGWRSRTFIFHHTLSIAGTAFGCTAVYRYNARQRRFYCFDAMLKTAFDCNEAIGNGYYFFSISYLRHS